MHSHETLTELLKCQHRSIPKEQRTKLIFRTDLKSKGLIYSCFCLGVCIRKSFKTRRVKEAGWVKWKRMGVGGQGVSSRLGAGPLKP